MHGKERIGEVRANLPELGTKNATWRAVAGCAQVRQLHITTSLRAARGKRAGRAPGCPG